MAVWNMVGCFMCGGPQGGGKTSPTPTLTQVGLVSNSGLQRRCL